MSGSQVVWHISGGWSCRDELGGMVRRDWEEEGEEEGREAMHFLEVEHSDQMVMQGWGLGREIRNSCYGIYLWAAEVK